MSETGQHKITSFENINRSGKSDNNYRYFIKTSNGGYITVQIENYVYCCEVFGVYAMKNGKNVNDSLDDFVGKEIVNIVVSKETEIEIEKTIVEMSYIRWVEIYMKEDPLPLMLYLYNDHNGFYSHDCTIEWKGQCVPDESFSFSL